MTFAIAMSLVLFISTAMLLYQFWNQSVLDSESDAPQTEQPAETPTQYLEHAA